MLPRDTLAVAPLARTAAAGAVEAAGDARQQAFQRALASQLGKSLQGEILTKLTDGSFIVRVAGTPARMLLPAGFQAGAQVPLTLVALTPRPAFEVGGGAFTEAGPPLPAGADPHAAPLAWLDGSSARALGGRGALAQAQVQVKALLAHAPLTPTAQLPQAGLDDIDAASLSATGRLLGSVLAAALRAGQSGDAVVGRLPLLNAPGADSAALAAALRDGVARSGLFYESHVADWAHGQRTLAELAAEPQMAGPRPGAPDADPATASLISMQLAAHEQDRIAWQGQLWPGQPLQLEVRREGRDGPGRDGGDGAAESSWQSRLRLRFGALGELAASVVLAGEQLHIELNAGSAATGALLRAHAGNLAQALAAAGTPLATLAVNDPKAGDE
jgi:hypothetical protein